VREFPDERELPVLLGDQGMRDIAASGDVIDPLDLLADATIRHAMA